MCCNFRCHHGDGALRKQRVRCLATRLATKNTTDMYCGTRHRPTSTFRERKPQQTIFRLVQMLQLQKRCGTDNRQVSGAGNPVANKQNCNTELRQKHQQQQVLYPGPTNFSVFCQIFAVAPGSPKQRSADDMEAQDSGFKVFSPAV